MTGRCPAAVEVTRAAGASVASRIELVDRLRCGGENSVALLPVIPEAKPETHMLISQNMGATGPSCQRWKGSDR
jgi:hypothetical protein